MANTFLTPAVALYKAPHFTGYDSNNVITLNADRIQAFTPRPAWIKRYLVPGQNQIQYLLTFEPSSADLLDPNILTGVYIEQDGAGVVIDCTSVTAFDTAINNQTPIPQNYAAGIPLFVSPTALAYCITRADNGSAAAIGDLSTDYVGQYYGNVRLRSNVSGISHYTVFSFQPIIAQLNSVPGVPSTSWVLDQISVGACTS